MKTQPGKPPRVRVGKKKLNELKRDQEILQKIIDYCSGDEDFYTEGMSTDILEIVKEGREVN